MKGRRRSRTSLCALLLSLVLMLVTCGQPPQQKVFVLGMDGLTFDLLLPWVQEGKLPHFRKLMEESCSTQLISTIPPSSPPAWTSAVTGVNPGKHGIFGFVKELKAGQDDAQMLFYTARDRKADPLWTILTERGRRSVVVNVPCSSPPDEIEGIMISGFPHISATDFTSPPDYRLEIPDYRIDIYGQLVSVHGEDAFLEDMNDIMDRRAEVIFKLMEEERWDMFFAVFTLTDRIQHYFWKFMDPQHPGWEPGKAKLYGNAILKAYQRMDELLGQIRSRLDDRTTLVVMSDHGFGPVYQLVNGENFLEQRMPKGSFRAVADDNFGAKFSLKIKPGTPFDQKNRDALAETKEALREALANLEDPASSQKVIQNIFLAEDLYWGPYTSKAPQILGLESRGYLFWNWYPTEDEALFPPRDDPIFSRFFSAFHRLNGVLIMNGANVSKGENGFDAHIFDIAPTVLYLLGEPVPLEMDGNVLDAAISPDYVQRHPVDVRWERSAGSRRTEALSDSAEAINRFIEEQLRAIGYVR